jgi:hypothetical protein
MKTSSCIAWAAALALALSAGAGAHEGHHHEAKGTIQSVAHAEIVLKTVDGEQKTFVVSEATKCTRGASPIVCHDAVVGERAVVSYETKDGADRALEVKLAEKKS